MIYFGRAFLLASLVRLITIFAFPTLLFAERDSLLIYWIDVEGGAATLVVTPTGQSILTDSGWNTSDGRDANLPIGLRLRNLLTMATVLNKLTNMEDGCSKHISTSRKHAGASLPPVTGCDYRALISLSLCHIE